MNASDVHHDWLSLIDISGPFLAVPVLKEVYPQGLEELDGNKRKRLRQAYEEWREALDFDDSRFPELHAAWINEVLSRGLELDDDGKGDVLKRADWCATNLSIDLPEHGVKVSPDLAIIDEQRGNKPLMLITIYSQDIDLDASFKLDGWAATPAERMVQLCRSIGCRLGLVTNGERWMLVNAPVGGVTTFASWYARIWGQEPITLQAFVHLLGIRRFFVDESEQLPALFDSSLRYQGEVTDALGKQVQRAIEVLIQALDKADQDRGRELLQNVKEPELYEAALTVMMRLVFLLSAEERGLLLLGDERYEANYALSTLRMQLRTEPEEILERRLDAWSRLLAIFRVVFAGIEHENLRLPALGGSLFDPDRFPFLEGRAKGSNWRTDMAKPLPIDNRTVLLLLDAIQQFQGRTLSYRALDVEQIGYVYEGLLERTVKRIDEVTLELDSTKNAKTPLVRLAELESAKLDGANRLVKLLEERSGSSASRVRNDLARPVDSAHFDKLLTVCQGDLALRDRIKPYVHLLRTDPWGYPLVYPKGAFIITTGSDRRETGTHYTPKSLTEAIVEETLIPLVYIGPADAKPKSEWKVKPPAELLALKVCDPAMGSGAFLVQVCRWLSDRLVESWAEAEVEGGYITVGGEVVFDPETRELLPQDAETRTVVARQIIAERILYGVDINPLAVELAKLSIWLVTLAKGRPFGFLDHNFRVGDSLLGIHSLSQLTELSMASDSTATQMRVFGRNIEHAVLDAIELRQSLRKMPIRDIDDIKTMAQLHARVCDLLSVPELIADILVGEFLRCKGNAQCHEATMAELSVRASSYLGGNIEMKELLLHQAKEALSVDIPFSGRTRMPLHWPLAFPEVFMKNSGGFDALVGNPPFLGGQKLTGFFGVSYREYLVEHVAFGVRGSADLVAYFFLRAHSLLKQQGTFGLLATNTIAEGDSREVGLDRLVTNGEIYSAYPDEPWPGQAAVITSRVHYAKGTYAGKKSLNGIEVDNISSFLSAEEDTKPFVLKSNSNKSFIGSYVLGMGFTMSESEASELIAKTPKNRHCLYPYLNGQDLNSSPTQKPSRWVINFWDWPEDRAKQYPELYDIVLQKVKPERNKLGDNSTAAGRKKKWWLYGRDSKALYHVIGRHDFFEKHVDRINYPLQPMDRVLVACRVSKYTNYIFMPNDIVFDIANNVYAYDRYAYFAFLQSTISNIWSWKNASKLKNDLRNSPSDTFETLAFPSVLPADDVQVSWSNSLVQELEEIGEKYHEFRSSCMTRLGIGLTKLYNAFHCPGESNEDLAKLRAMHKQVDELVLKAFGWSDINLAHDFYEVSYLPINDRVRFTITEPARLEILRRLQNLNKERHEAEVNTAPSKGTIVKKPRKKSGDTTYAKQALLFSEVDSAPISATSNNEWGITPVDQILAWLEAHKGWFRKETVLNGCGAAAEFWDDAIAELLKDDFVVTHGSGEDTRYGVKD